MNIQVLVIRHCKQYIKACPFHFTYFWNNDRQGAGGIYTPPHVLSISNTPMKSWVKVLWHATTKNIFCLCLRKKSNNSYEIIIFERWQRRSNVVVFYLSKTVLKHVLLYHVNGPLTLMATGGRNPPPSPVFVWHCLAFFQKTFESPDFC